MFISSHVKVCLRVCAPMRLRVCESARLRACCAPARVPDSTTIFKIRVTT